MNIRMHLCAAIIGQLVLVNSHFAIAQDDQKAKPPNGLEFSKWSGAVNVPDPVAISLDNQGRAYVTQTQRRKAQDLDIRAHRDWIPNDVSFQSIDDKRNFYRQRLAVELGNQQHDNLEDRNRDGSFDFRDLTVLSEKIHLLFDADADGTADTIRLFAEGFQTEVTGIAAGVLWHDGDVYATIAPDVWKLRDTDGDDKADTRDIVATGFGLHIAYGGHDMHGLTVGPDGRIYWSVGDKGISVTSRQGRKFHYPNQGGVMRCEPDGSNFEVFAHGLRNVQEPAFDEFGNLFGVDNDADFQGEKERFIYIVEGMDAGWRCNYQYRGSDYNPWTEEKLWHQYSEGQPAHILPPLSHYQNGPAGFTYNPGTALSPAYRRYFFLNSAPNGQQYAFQVRPSGASFEMINEHQIGDGIPLVGATFGPDGALYSVDWGGGYPLNQKGAVWKIDDPNHANDPLRLEVKRLLAEGFRDKASNELVTYLAHSDQRVRLGAQFELVRRQELQPLASVATSAGELLSRIHAIWGLGQLARYGHADAIPPLRACLVDTEAEVLVQAAKMCRELKDFDGKLFIPLIDHANPRVKFHGAMAAAKHPTSEAFDAVFPIADEMYTVDPYLRHAFVQVFTTCTTDEQLRDFYDYDFEFIRQLCVLALRNRKSPVVAQFLNDLHDHVACDAARAIHDDFSISEAMPDLALALEEFPFYSEAYIRRAINANFRLGQAEHIARVAIYAARQESPLKLRLEAMNAMSQWLDPPPLDRVTGRYRKLATRQREPLAAALTPKLTALLNDSNPQIQARAMALATQYKIQLDNDVLVSVVKNAALPSELRSEALNSLVAGDSQRIDEAIGVSLESVSSSLRIAARRHLSTRDKQAALHNLQEVLQSPSSIREQQSALVLLGELATNEADQELLNQLGRANRGELRSELKLELIEAAQARSSNNASIAAGLERLVSATTGNANDPVSAFDECRLGGDASKGKATFMTHLTAACIRCHRVGKKGSTVGPNLEDVARKRDVNYLLRSIVAPSADIDEKYRTQVLFLNSGRIVQGLLSRKTETETILFDAQGKEVRIANDEIDESEEQKVSIMPEMSKVLTRREIRDLVAYLSTLKQANDDGRK